MSPALKNFALYTVILLIFALPAACFAGVLAATFEDMPQSDSRSLGTNVTDYIVSSESSSSVKRMSELYTKGLVREKLGAYDNAVSTYGSVASKAMEILNAKETTPDVANQVLPYAIAAAYRKGILTHRSVEGSVMKLYRQLELYQDADSWINEILTSISNLTTEKKMSIPPYQYYPLYYARAYNRVGWAYALLNGSAWKRYIIYTPADAVNMVDKSMGDLKTALEAFDVDYSRNGGGDIDGKAEKTLSNIGVNSPEYMTFALCFNTYKLSAVRGIAKKQLSNTIRATLEKYDSATVISAFKYGKKIFTYEEFMKPETKDVIAAMASILDEMK